MLASRAPTANHLKGAPTVATSKKDVGPDGLTKHNAVDPDGISKRSAIEEDDVEGHSMRRDGDGATSRRGADLGEGISKRNFTDGDDDVEGHSMVRRGEGAISRKLGPGEGRTSRT